MRLEEEMMKTFLKSLSAFTTLFLAAVYPE